MENSQISNQNQNNEYIYWKSNYITKLLKSSIDRKNIAKELSKFII